MQTRSIHDQLVLNPRPAGFDHLRIILALLIVCDHSIDACGGLQAQRDLFGGVLRPFMTCLVPMFFALSGFLVANSLVRSKSLVTFAGLRALRIVPALAVDTIFCGLILGVALTDRPLGQYLSSPDFGRYFLNILGDIHYVLPGVFSHNPTNLVNAQLWTIPFELKCYAILTAMAFVGWQLRRRVFLFASGIATFAIMADVWHHPIGVIDVWPLLVPSFLLSVCVFLYRDRLGLSGRWMVVAVVLAFALLMQRGPMMVLAALPISYLTVWLGLLDPPRGPLIRSGDYSYPLYLYSCPIQQAVYSLVPWAHHWEINLLVALPLAFLFAAGSWHLIEKPMQSKRRYLYAFENWRQRRSNKPLSRTAPRPPN